MVVSAAASELAGHVCLIAGGSVGIGRAVAMLVARRGGVPLICGRDQGRLDDAVAELRAIGAPAKGIQTDIGDASDVERMFAQVADAHGGIDSLVCAAGSGLIGTVETLDEAMWRQSVSDKLLASYRLARGALPLLKARGGGAIIAIASVHGHANTTERDAVAPMNAALSAFTRALAVSHAGANIRANSVSPGPVETPTWRRNWEGMFPHLPFATIRERVGESIPLGRIATPDDVAEVIAFLISPRAAYLSGVDIPIDGGLLAALAMKVRIG